MFSAIALVAFSFAGMANTGGEEKLEIKDSTIEMETLSEKQVVYSCLGYAIRNMVIESGATEGGYSNEQMIEAFSFYLDLCNDLGGAVEDVMIIQS